MTSQSYRKRCINLVASIVHFNNDTVNPCVKEQQKWSCPTKRSEPEVKGDSSLCGCLYRGHSSLRSDQDRQKQVLVTGSIYNLRHGKGMSQVKGPSRAFIQEQNKVRTETGLKIRL